MSCWWWDIWIYGRYTEKVFGIDPGRKTPAYALRDNVDYVPLPGWRVFLIQFLNIAGLGPIFGAIMGAKFGASGVFVDRFRLHFRRGGA